MASRGAAERVPRGDIIDFAKNIRFMPGHEPENDTASTSDANRNLSIAPVLEPETANTLETPTQPVPLSVANLAIADWAASTSLERQTFRRQISAANLSIIDWAASTELEH